MIIATIDPISFKEVTDIAHAPYVIEGEGEHALKIYFESEHNRQEYLAIEMHGTDGTSGLKHIYDAIADNPDTGSVN